MTPPKHRREILCRETWSFTISGYDMRHDEGVYRLDIEVSYTYVPGIRDDEYPDWRLVAADIKDFLDRYPNPKHYWEIVNKGLAKTLAAKYPVLDSLTIKIVVPPLESNALQRTSTVTLKRRPPHGARRPGLLRLGDTAVHA